MIIICTLLKGKFKQNEMKRTTGIPRTFLQLATAETPGVKMCKGMYLRGVTGYKILGGQSVMWRNVA